MYMYVCASWKADLQSAVGTDRWISVTETILSTTHSIHILHSRQLSLLPSAGQWV